MLSGNDIKESPIQYKTAVALGSFDAMHRGHMKVINEAASYAKKYNCKSAVYMFRKSPKFITGVDRTFINTVEKRAEILADIGIDYAVIEDFTDDYRRISCEKFVDNYIGKFLNAEYVCVGFNYRFGYMGEGDPETLTEMCREIGIETYVSECISFENTISSSYIKTLIADGSMDECTRYLGREFSIKSKVVHGSEIGRTLGFPTANMEIPVNMVCPKFGVYITRAIIGGRIYPAITNVGTRPTIDQGAANIETNIQGFSGDIYGEEIEVSFVKRIRDIVKFDSTDELKAQLAADKGTAAEYFGIKD